MALTKVGETETKERPFEEAVAAVQEALTPGITGESKRRIVLGVIADRGLPEGTVRAVLHASKDL